LRNLVDWLGNHWWAEGAAAPAVDVAEVLAFPGFPLTRE
jgi:hypothetical protein